MHVSSIPVIIAAACILHNVCEIHGESFNDAWLSEEGNSLPQASTTTRHSVVGNRAIQVRDTLLYCTLTVILFLNTVIMKSSPESWINYLYLSAYFTFIVLMIGVC